MNGPNVTPPIRDKIIQVLAEALGTRLGHIRLSRNLTQAQLAEDAGTSLRTIKRLEAGENASLDTLLRVLRALRLDAHLETFLPDPDIRPLERVKLSGQERQRASGRRAAGPASAWAWGEEEDE